MNCFNPTRRPQLVYNFVNNLRFWLSELYDFFWLSIECHCGPLLALHNWGKSRLSYYMGVRVPTRELLAACSETRDWEKAPIRCVALHPDGTQKAFVTRKNHVIMYFENVRDHLKLRHESQQDVSCAAFRPFAKSELAVGGAHGICLWSNNHRRLSEMRNLCDGHNMDLLQDKGHTFITSLQWNRDGVVLASAALGTPYIVLWDTERKTRLQLVTLGWWKNWSPIRLIKFRPNSQELFCASIDRAATTWHIRSYHYHAEYMPILGTVLSAAWLTCGCYMLYILDNDSHLYAAKLNAEATIFMHPDSMLQIIKVVDLNSFCTTTSTAFNDYGQPLSIAIGPLNIYLAIIFKNQPFVQLCMLASRHDPLRVLPLKTIVSDYPMGQLDYPNCMCFSGKHDGKCIYLITCWSSGHVHQENFNTKDAAAANTISKDILIND